MLSIKTFTDSYNNNKKFHHVNLLGFKFRVANNKRSFKTRAESVYRTDRGIVFNLFDKRYLCIITKWKQISLWYWAYL